MNPFFSISSDNEKIKHIYGNYGFWAWVRYWYLDSANLVTLMLIDKNYYDYDYKQPAKKREVLTYESTKLSDEETYDMLANFGFDFKTKKERSANDIEIDELQQIAMEEINKRK